MTKPTVIWPEELPNVPARHVPRLIANRLFPSYAPGRFPRLHAAAMVNHTKQLSELLATGQVTYRNVDGTRRAFKALDDDAGHISWEDFSRYAQDAGVGALLVPGTAPKSPEPEQKRRALLVSEQNQQRVLSALRREYANVMALPPRKANGHAGIQKRLRELLGDKLSRRKIDHAFAALLVNGQAAYKK